MGGFILCVMNSIKSYVDTPYVYIACYVDIFSASEIFARHVLLLFKPAENATYYFIQIAKYFIYYIINFFTLWKCNNINHSRLPVISPIWITSDESFYHYEALNFSKLTLNFINYN